MPNNSQNNLDKFGLLSKNTWNQLAKEDAEYYILSDKEKKGGKWDKASFLARGKEQWLGFKNLLSHYGLAQAVARDKTALDLGCGVGRMAFAMSSDFKEVFGVDAAETMIEKAKEYQKALGTANVEFSVNNGSDLRSFVDNSLDFVFSYIVLQHCPSSWQVLKYTNEFSRVLKKGGVCLFQTRVSPTLGWFLKFNIQKKIRRMKYCGKQNNYVKEAVMGNWVYYPRLYRTLKKNFSAFYLVFSPPEIYESDFWKLNSEFDRWKRSFVICIK
ncbi:MAG: class I SAM-dependent methyltransferase [Patescibacteria group bacterium]|nr:class I SAM-dependent methyltransferase [Patescibacteria group bacterium]